MIVVYLLLGVLFGCEFIVFVFGDEWDVCWDDIVCYVCCECEEFIFVAVVYVVKEDVVDVATFVAVFDYEIIICLLFEFWVKFVIVFIVDIF